MCYLTVVDLSLSTKTSQQSMFGLVNISAPALSSGLREKVKVFLDYTSRY
ncbi:MAG: hypothetical protein M3R69_00785 [Acidobacteriota bacterium]|nr:hypothetical protein [Acidobacteriota bacterium]